MLLNITVENFRSYDKEQTLSLITNNKQTTNSVRVGEFNVLKSAVIYGANASGKSNLIHAINCIKEIMRTGVPTDKYAPFFLNDMDTKFSLDFSIANEVFTYSIHFNAQRISYEALLDELEYPIFERSYVVDKYSYNIPKPKLLLDEEQLTIANNILKQWQLTTNQDKTFLKHIIDNNCSKLKYILDIFGNKGSSNARIIIKFNSYHRYKFQGEDDSSSGDIVKATEYYERQHDFNSVSKVLRSIGATFDKLIPQYIDIGLSKTKELKLIASYNVNGKTQEENFLSTESDGTIKFYSYFALFNYLIEFDGVFVVDEFEAHFHPLLVEELINIFHNSNSKAQLIFTTHNPMLLGQSIFEPEQVYFADKTEHTYTNLYSLADFRDLKLDDNIMKKYLAGNFGAVPYFHSFDFMSNK